MWELDGFVLALLFSIIDWAKTLRMTGLLKLRFRISETDIFLSMRYILKVETMTHSD